ncbi:MAG: hypothetical protein M0Z25_03370 [Nitrospiraceae bacterium]|nr:hypothetical protein [Nitrospiraceae bacterium]
MKTPLRTLSMITRSLLVSGIAASSLLVAAAVMTPTSAGEVWAKTTETKVLYVTQNGSREKTLDLELGQSSRLHYNHFWMDVTRTKPFVDSKGRKVIIPDTPTFRGIQEITVRFWHPRGEPNLLDAIVVKAYDSQGRLVKHGAFDRGVFVLLLSNSLFKGNYVRFDGIGHYVRADKSLYVKVLVRKTRQVAIIPFADFINDFTRQINTQPVVSWAVKRP